MHKSNGKLSVNTWKFDNIDTISIQLIQPQLMQITMLAVSSNSKNVWLGYTIMIAGTLNVFNDDQKQQIQQLMKKI